MVIVSESAQGYLGQLIENQEDSGMGVRMFVTQTGTKMAETCLARNLLVIPTTLFCSWINVGIFNLAAA